MCRRSKAAVLADCLSSLCTDVAAFLVGAKPSPAVQEVERCCIKGRDGCESGLERRGILTGQSTKCQRLNVEFLGMAVLCHIG